MGGSDASPILNGESTGAVNPRPPSAPPSLKEIVRFCTYARTDPFDPSYDAQEDVYGLLDEASRTLNRIKVIADRPDKEIEEFSFNDLVSYDVQNDENSVLGHRWLCRGGSSLWVGPSGIGKSSISMQCAIFWACGLPLWGLRPTLWKRLKSLFIQAENDQGDLADMLQGVINSMPIPSSMSREEVYDHCRDLAKSPEKARSRCKR